MKVYWRLMSLFFCTLLLTSLSQKQASTREVWFDLMKKGSVTKVKDFLKKEKSLKPTCSDENAWTGLHWAASKGHVSLMKFLVEKKVGFHWGNLKGESPLHIAALFGEVKAMKFLIGQGASLKAKDREDKVPLHHAVYSGKRKAVEYLVEVGATLEEKDFDEKTPLHYAVELGYTDIAAFLLQRGAEVNTLDYDGETPLEVAIEKKDELMGKLLLTFDAGYTTKLGALCRKESEKGENPVVSIIEEVIRLGFHGESSHQQKVKLVKKWAWEHWKDYYESSVIKRRIHEHEKEIKKIENKYKDLPRVKSKEKISLEDFPDYPYSSDESDSSCD